MIIFLLLLFGFALLFLEIFLPGLVAGLLGSLCLWVAVAEAYLHKGLSFALFLLFGELAIIGLGFCLWTNWVPHTRLGRRLFLTESNLPPPSSDQLQFNEGEEGLAVTELRPAGTAEFHGKRCDVVAESSFIPPLAKVKIYRIEKYRVVVRQT